MLSQFHSSKHGVVHQGAKGQALSVWAVFVLFFSDDGDSLLRFAHISVKKTTPIVLHLWPEGRGADGYLQNKMLAGDKGSRGVVCEVADSRTMAGRIRDTSCPVTGERHGTTCPFINNDLMQIVGRGFVRARRPVLSPSCSETAH